MKPEDTTPTQPVGNQKKEKASSKRVKRTSNQPATHTDVHRGTSPHKADKILVAGILQDLDDKRKQALDLHHASTEDSERSLVAGVYSEALSDAIEIVKHRVTRSWKRG